MAAKAGKKSRVNMHYICFNLKMMHSSCLLDLKDADSEVLLSNFESKQNFFYVQENSTRYLFKMCAIKATLCISDPRVVATKKALCQTVMCVTLVDPI